MYIVNTEPFQKTVLRSVKQCGSIRLPVYQSNNDTTEIERAIFIETELVVQIRDRSKTTKNISETQSPNNGRKIE